MTNYEDLWDWCFTEVLKLENGQDVWKQIQKCKDNKVSQARAEALKEANDLLTSDSCKEKYVEILEEAKAEERQRCLETLPKLRKHTASCSSLPKQYRGLCGCGADLLNKLIDQAISAISNKPNNRK